MTKQRMHVAAVLVSAVMLAAGCRDTGKTQRVEATALLDRDGLDFGDVPVGEWREQVIRVQNGGQIMFRAVEVVRFDDNPSFHVEMDDGKIAPGEERLITVRFHPLKEGALQSDFRVETDAEDEHDATVPVRGNGTPTPITLFPPELHFETLEIDSERFLNGEVKNPVDVPLTIRVVGGDGMFTTDEVTVPPFSTQRLAARFFPTELGWKDAKIEVRSCEDCTPKTIFMDGESVPSALVFDPAPVPFENIPVHEKTTSQTMVRNITWRPVELSAVKTSDPAFTVLSEHAGVLEPGAAQHAMLEFAARTSGPSTGTLTFEYMTDKARSSQVILDARGGRPQLALTPVSIDFGRVPVGGKVEAVIRMSNAGSQGEIRFQGVTGEGQFEQFSVSEPYRGDGGIPWSPGSTWPTMNAPSIPIAAGADYLDIKAFFQPTAEGKFEGRLKFRSDDLFQPEREVFVTGEAYGIGACQFEVAPANLLDFGNVPFGQGAVLGFQFRNTGTETCAVKDIHLSDTAGGAFFMPGGALTGGVVIKDAMFSAQVAFRPKAEGAFQGELSITVSSPGTPVYKLPIRGFSGETCLVAAPRYVDFGSVRYDCSPEPRTLAISNQCDHPVTVSSAAIGEGTSNQFSLSGAPSFPRLMAPGDRFELEVGYARNVHAQHYSPLFVQAQGEPAPLLVPLLAETNHEGRFVERYVQGNQNQLDLLFVVTNTTTMDAYQAKLRAAIPGFLDSARAQGIDVRVGVTTSGLVERSPQCPGGAQGGEAGRLFPADGSRPRVLSSNNTNSTATLQQNLTVGLCHNLVQGLEGMRAALSSPLITNQDDPRSLLPNDGNLGFLRASARLAIVVLSDEDDHSGFDPDSYVQFLKALKGPGMSHRTQVWSIIPTDGSCVTAGPTAPRYAEVANGTGGATYEVCRADYAPFLGQVLSRAVGLQRDFRLTYTPNSVAEIDVYVERVKAPTTDWTLNTAKNEIVFSSSAVPAAGDDIEVRYRAVCPTGPN